ncbi:MAG: hypothetical protein ACK522_11125 [Synechococcaceae cyanobacterium]
MGNAPTSAIGDGRGPLRVIVAITPLLGSLAFPIVVPLLMVRVSLSAGMLAAVMIGSLWFVAMLRTSEMPAHE